MKKIPAKPTKNISAYLRLRFPSRRSRNVPRLGAEVRLPEEKNIVQNPLVRRFNPPAGSGIVKNQVAGGILVEDHAGQRQFQGAGRVFKLEVAQGEPEAAGKRLIFFAVPEGESVVVDQQCAHSVSRLTKAPAIVKTN